MSLLRLTLVAVLSLAVIALPLIGLFKAPWYILLLVLAVGYAVTQFAMAPSETVMSSSSTGAIEPELASTGSEPWRDQSQSLTDQSSLLTYRGANYNPISPPTETETEEIGSETFSGKYRGCEWSHQSASQDGQVTEPSTTDRPTPVRMYRGVKISPS